MKGIKLILILISFWVLNIGKTQNARNFICPDCSLITHNLFSELESGRVIVLDWVMPCGACTGPTKTTNNIVQTYLSSHPGKVFMYLADDFANSTCNTLNSWVEANSLKNITVFSNNQIKMSDYGDEGMPKVVVIGPDKRVYYNANYVVNANDLISAIDSALAVGQTMSTKQLNENDLKVYPNPAFDLLNLEINDFDLNKLSISITDITGRKICLRSDFIKSEDGTVSLDISNFDSGIYFLQIGDGLRTQVSRFVKTTF